MFNSWFYFSYDRHQNLRTSLFWVFRKKKPLPARFLVKFIACTINCAGKLICLRACLNKRYRAGLIDTPNKGHCDAWFKSKKSTHQLTNFLVKSKKPCFQSIFGHYPQNEIFYQISVSINFSYVKVKMLYMINHIWFVRLSCCFKKIRNVNTNVVF